MGNMLNGWTNKKSDETEDEEDVIRKTDFGSENSPDEEKVSIQNDIPMKNFHSTTPKYGFNDDIICVSDSDSGSDEHVKSPIFDNWRPQKSSLKVSEKRNIPSCKNIFAEIKNKNELNSKSRFSRNEQTNLFKTADGNTEHKGAKSEIGLSPKFQLNRQKLKTLWDKRQQQYNNSSDGSSSVEIEQVESDSDVSSTSQTTQKGKVSCSNLPSGLQQTKSNLLRYKSIYSASTSQSLNKDFDVFGEKKHRNIEKRKSTPMMKAQMPPSSPECIPESDDEEGSRKISSSNDESGISDTEATQEPDYDVMFKMLTRTSDSTSEHEDNTAELMQNPDLGDKKPKHPEAGTSNTLYPIYSDSDSDSLPDCKFLTQPFIHDQTSDNTSFSVESLAQKDVDVRKPTMSWESKNIKNDNKGQEESTNKFELKKTKVKFNVTDTFSNKSMMSQSQTKSQRRSNPNVSIFEKMATSSQGILPSQIDSDIEMDDKTDVALFKSNYKKYDSFSDSCVDHMPDKILEPESKKKGISKTDGKSFVTVLSSSDTDVVKDDKSIDEFPKHENYYEQSRNISSIDRTYEEMPKNKIEARTNISRKKIFEFEDGINCDKTVAALEKVDDDVANSWSYTQNDDDDIIEVFDSDDEDAVFCLSQVPLYIKQEPASDEDGEKEDVEKDDEVNEEVSAMLNKCGRNQLEEEEEPLQKVPKIESPEAKEPEIFGMEIDLVSDTVDNIYDQDFSDEDIFNDSDLFDQMQKNIVDKEAVKRMTVDSVRSISQNQEGSCLDTGETEKKVMISDKEKKVNCEEFQEDDNENSQMFSDDELSNDLTDIDSSGLDALKKAEVLRKSTLAMSSSEDEFYHYITQVDGFNTPGKVSLYSNLKFPEKTSRKAKKRSLSIKDVAKNKRKRHSKAVEDDILECTTQSSSDDDAYLKATQSISMPLKVLEEKNHESQTKVDVKISHQSHDHKNLSLTSEKQRPIQQELEKADNRKLNKHKCKLQETDSDEGNTLYLSNEEVSLKPASKLIENKTEYLSSDKTYKNKIIFNESQNMIEISKRQEKVEELRNQDEASSLSNNASLSSRVKSATSSRSSSTKHSSKNASSSLSKSKSSSSSKSKSSPSCKSKSSSSSKSKSSSSAKSKSHSSSKHISEGQATEILSKSTEHNLSTSKENESSTSKQLLCKSSRSELPSITKPVRLSLSTTKSSSSSTKPSSSASITQSKSTTSFYKKKTKPALPTNNNLWYNKSHHSALKIAPKKKRNVKGKKNAEEPFNFTQKISNAREQMKLREYLPDAPQIPTAKYTLVKKRNELDEMNNSDVQLPDVDDIRRKQLPILSCDVNQIKRSKELEQEANKPVENETSSKHSGANAFVKTSKNITTDSEISNQCSTNMTSTDNIIERRKSKNEQTGISSVVYNARINEKYPVNAEKSSIESIETVQSKTTEKTKEKADVGIPGVSLVKSGEKARKRTMTKKSANEILLDDLLSKVESVGKKTHSGPTTSNSTAPRTITTQKQTASNYSSSVSSSRAPLCTLNQMSNPTINQTKTIDRPRLDPCDAAHLKTTSVSKNNINLMSKNYNEPVSRPFVQKTSTVEKIFAVDDFHRIILNWNPIWLKEQDKMNGSLPPLLGKDKGLFPLLESYSNIQDYQEIMLNLLAYETWESVSRDSKENNVTFNVGLERVQQMKGGDEFMFVEWLGILPQSIFSSGNYPREMDLLRIDVSGQRLNEHKLVCFPQMGLVQHVYVKPQSDKSNLCIRAPSLEKEPLMKNGDVTTIKLVIKMKFRKFCLNRNYLANVQCLTNLVTIQRQISALAYFPRSPLHRDILKPGSKQVYCHQVTTSSKELQNEFDPSQSSAICSIAGAIQQPPFVPKICILQGPPGTGKSHTIVGLLKRIIHQRKSGGSQCRVCLATPSNAAVDELMRRLVLDKRKTRKNKNDTTINFVRIGFSNKMDQDLRSHCWDILVKNKCNSVLQCKQNENIPDSVKEDMKRLEERITKMKIEIQTLRDKSDNLKAEKLSMDLNKLMNQQRNLQKQSSQFINKNIVLSGKEKFMIKRDILLQADVLCGTLSGFGNPQIIEILKNDKSNQSRRNEHFTCVIIDEASQAAELDSLIPLQYGMSKLVLVGDPEQLPATVLSKKAGQMNFGQSLLERLYNYSKDKNQSAIALLKTQYRMDSKIFHFPNKLIYDDQLTTHKSVEQLSEKFPLVPYLVFDMICGRETTSGQSICNTTEATCTVQLCDLMLKCTKLKEAQIGIICPYQTQKALVLQQLREKNLYKIDVDTVDGFQGREKLVIILNCVRSHSATGGIGFLADRRRMNVAITRAKSALYILGNLDSLQHFNEDSLSVTKHSYNEFEKMLNFKMELSNINP